MRQFLTSAAVCYHSKCLTTLRKTWVNIDFERVAPVLLPRGTNNLGCVTWQEGLRQTSCTNTAEIFLCTDNKLLFDTNSKSTLLQLSLNGQTKSADALHYGQQRFHERDFHSRTVVRFRGTQANVFHLRS